jgi:serine/threonine protein kinase
MATGVARVWPAGVPDGYEFIRRLGDGANGAVLLARHVSLDRLVAIKVLHAGRYDRQGQRRLEREGRAVASLRHPNIVAVHLLQATPAGYALVMEYLPGGDLRGLMDSGALTGSHALLLLTEIAAGLAHAHAEGVVHRDVKPANVLITADGHAKIGDFGLARLSRAGGVFRTVDGAARGSPAYLAPEQILDPTRESPAADAYSFAVLAYELVVGQRPFTATSVAAMINDQLNEAPTAPRELAPGLPDDAERALLAGLAKQPQARLSPRQLVEQLDALTPADWDAWFATRRIVPDAVDPTAVADVTQAAAAPDPVTDTAAATPGPRPSLTMIPTNNSAQLSAASSTPRRSNAVERKLRRARIAVLICAILVGALVGLAVALVTRQL